MVKINKDIIIDGTNKTLGDLANSSSSNNYLPITGGTLTGDLRIKGSSNYGNKLNLGDGDYVHLYEIEDDVLEIKASEIRLNADEVKVNGNNIPIITYKDYSEAVSVKANNHGWFQISTSAPSGYSLLGYVILGNGFVSELLVTIIDSNDTRCAFNYLNRGSGTSYTIKFRGLYIKS